LGSDVLWQIVCAAWSSDCLSKLEANKISLPIMEALMPQS
jgi:hypothetical protein